MPTNSSEELSCKVQNLHLSGFKVSNAEEAAAFHHVVEEFNQEIIRANHGQPLRLFDDRSIRTIVSIAVSLLVEKSAAPRQLDDRLQKLVDDCDDTLGMGF